MAIVTSAVVGTHVVPYGGGNSQGEQLCDCSAEAMVEASVEASAWVEAMVEAAPVPV